MRHFLSASPPDHARGHQDHRREVHPVEAPLERHPGDQDREQRDDDHAEGRLEDVLIDQRWEMTFEMIMRMPRSKALICRSDFLPRITPINQMASTSTIERSA